MATLGVPASPGVPAAAAAATLDAEFNDLQSVEGHFADHPDSIAAVIVEPVVGNMGCVPPQPGFLAGLRDLCTRHGALLILDEVMTGFRVALGGAQERYGVKPDLCCLGKVIGGGLPVGAYGGRRDLMERVAPAGPVYQAGTLSGNPLAMAAGLAQLRHLAANPDVYTRLEEGGRLLEDALADHIARRSLPARVARVGSMGTLFFTREEVRGWRQANLCDRGAFAYAFHGALRRGVHLPPAQFEAWFHSAAHTTDDMERVADALCAALDEVFA